MSKTIVVGVGGTGLDVIRALRRKVVETRGSLAAAPHLGFFYIDTDDKEVKDTEDNRERWEILGTSVKLSPHEYFMIPAPNFGRLAQDLASFPNVKNWLPMEKLKVLEQTDRDAAGARQIRPLGRLGFTLATAEIERHFKALLAHVQPPKEGGDTQVYVVGSLSGGTGSGIFLDLAYQLKSWVTERHHSYGFLVFPDLSVKRDARYVPNAYAALMELNYFNSAGSRVKDGTAKIGYRLPGSSDPIYDKPFDSTYIVGTRNRENVKISLSATAEMIAHRLFLSFDSSFAEDARTLLNNGGAERAMPYRDDITGNLHSRNFFTFGLSSIEYPQQKIKELIAWRMVGEFLGGWVTTRETPGNVNELVRNSVEQLKLSDPYLLADRDIFSDSSSPLNFDDFRVQIQGDVAQMVAQAPDTNENEYFAEQVKNFLTSYRNRGVVTFYQDRAANLEGAVQEIVRQVRSRVNDFIQIPALGYEHAMRWLTGVARYASERQAAMVAERDGETVRLGNSPDTLERAYADLTTAEGKWLFRDDAMRTSRDTVRDVLTPYLTAYAATQALPYALRLLDGVIRELNTLIAGYTDWRLTLDRVLLEAKEEQEKRAHFLKLRLEGSADFNGAMLYTDALADTAYRTLDAKSALRYLGDHLHGRQDLLTLMSTAPSRDAALEEGYKLALHWMDHESRIQLSEKSVADQLLEEYPETKKDKRRTLLLTYRNRCSPFLPFDHIEMNMMGGTETIKSDHVAMMSDQNGSIPNVTKLHEDLRTVGYGGDSIKVIAATHQILFLREESAFTLRMVSDLAPVKAKYEEYRDNAGQPNMPDVPLHLQKSYDPPLMDLMLPRRDVFYRGEEDFLTGWVEGKIRFELNQADQIQEIRYRYERQGATPYVTLGTDWEQALEYWMREGREAAATREILNEDTSRMWKVLNTQPKKLEFAIKLSRHLEEIKARCETGEESPVFKAWDRIRRRMMEAHALPVPPAGTDLAPSAPSPAAQASSATTAAAPADSPATLADFRKFADLAVKTGKGKLTPAFAQSLESRRAALGLSEAGAQKAIQESMAAFNKPQPAELYRQTVAEFLAAGSIGDGEREFLTQLILDNGIDPDAAEKIEKEERSRAAGA